MGDLRRRGLEPLEQTTEVLRTAQLDADQGRTGLAVAALDVLEQRDVVVGPEHVVEEPAQGTRLLRELDEEVVLAAFVHERSLDHLGVTADVVISAGQDGQDPMAQVQQVFGGRAGRRDIVDAHVVPGDVVHAHTDNSQG